MTSVHSTSPWQIVACDVMGPFPRSPRGNQFLLVITDHFSKWVELFPLRKLTSQKVWECLLEVFTRFGFPSQLITDNATYFTSKVFRDSCHALGIRHTRTSAYHPQANITERVNRNLKSMLIAHTGRHKDWDNKLSEMGFATRTTINRSTGFTAAQLNFGRDLKFPLDSSLQPTQNRTDKSPATFAADLRKRLTESVREAREHLDISRLDQTSQYDKRRRDVQFSMGDLVLKRTHPLSDASKGFTASLAHRWDGPYTVVGKSNLSYVLKNSSTGASYGPVHVSELKRYFSREDTANGNQREDCRGKRATHQYSPSPRYNLRMRH